MVRGRLALPVCFMCSLLRAVFERRAASAVAPGPQTPAIGRSLAAREAEREAERISLLSLHDPSIAAPPPWLDARRPTPPIGRSLAAGPPPGPPPAGVLELVGAANAIQAIVRRRIQIIRFDRADLERAAARRADTERRAVRSPTLDLDERDATDDAAAGAADMGRAQLLADIERAAARRSGTNAAAANTADAAAAPPLAVASDRDALLADIARFRVDVRV